MGRDLDVRWLQIAMDDAVLVRCFESLRDLPCNRQGLIERDRSARDPIGERVALDELEDERVRLTAVLEPIDRTNVGMVEGGKQLRLALEAGEAIGIERKRARDDLERDVAPELPIARAIHLSHAACAKRGNDFVRPNSSAGSKGQEELWVSGRCSL